MKFAQLVKKRKNQRQKKPSGIRVSPGASLSEADDDSSRVFIHIHTVKISIRSFQTGCAVLMLTDVEQYVLRIKPPKVNLQLQKDESSPFWWIKP